jgi:CheY-like chemotaxis protein
MDKKLTSVLKSKRSAASLARMRYLRRLRKHFSWQNKQMRIRFALVLVASIALAVTVSFLWGVILGFGMLGLRLTERYVSHRRAMRQRAARKAGAAPQDRRKRDRLSKESTQEICPELRTAAILVAEDDDLNRMLLQKILTPHAGRLMVAVDGDDVIEKFISFKPDLVLMDVEMPGHNGMECTEAIRQFETGSDKHSIIIALTAGAMGSEREECIDAGMDDFLAKPVMRRDLLLRLEEHLGARARA